VVLTNILTTQKLKKKLITISVKKKQTSVIAKRTILEFRYQKLEPTDPLTLI